MNAIATIDPQQIAILSETASSLSELRPQVEQFAEINKSMVFDYRSKDGNKSARSHVALLRKTKKPIEDIHKRLTADWKAKKDAADKDKRELLSVVEEMISFHAEPLRLIEEEEKEAARLDAIRIDIEACWDLAHDMNSMFDRQRELDMQAAEQARIAAEQEAEQRRLQIEREKKEAAEKAAEEARLAEQARAAKAIEEAKERERKAIEEAAAAKAKAIEDAARQVREAEERAEREKAEAEANARAEEERKRKEEEAAFADLENTRRVHRAILSVLVSDHGIEEDRAKNIIMAIRAGAVPAVSIDYQWQQVPLVESEQEG